MGIYETVTYSPAVKWANGGETYWAISDPGYGQKRRRLVIANPWQQDPRETCYCCTCEDRPGSDVYCRNHGFAGTRPCKTHNMPGDIWTCDRCGAAVPNDHAPVWASSICEECEHVPLCSECAHAHLHEKENER